MGSRYQCFLLEPTNQTERSLRRYQGDLKCPGIYGYHNASVPFGIGRCHEESGEGRKVWKWDDESEDPVHEDLRWPTKCDNCEYLFQPADEWQVSREVLYVRKDTGVTMTLRNCPPGAMWDADWYPDKGPDGRALCVALPPDGGFDYWFIDGPSKGGGKWTRTGEPPNITATPSILSTRYHGWLRNGHLEEC